MREKETTNQFGKITSLRSKFASNYELIETAYKATKAMEMEGGDASDVFRSLRPYMVTIHLPSTLWGAALEYGPMDVEEACAAIWPVDVIEIAIEDGVNLPFADEPRNYTVLRVALARWTFPPGSFLFGRFDYEWMIFDVTKPDGHTELVQHVSFLRDASDGRIYMIPRANYGPSNPFWELESYRLRTLELVESAFEQDQLYWGNVFRFCKRIADLTQHRAARFVPITDPARPLSKEERKEKGYAERDHFRLRLAPGQTVSELLDDVRMRKNIHEWARRMFRFSRQVDAHWPIPRSPRSADPDLAALFRGPPLTRTFGTDFFDERGDA